MQRRDFIVSVIVLLGACAVSPTLAGCNYDTLIMPCLQTLNPQGQSQDQSGSKAKLNVIVKAFENLQTSCRFLNNFIQCADNVTKECDGSEQGSRKPQVIGIKKATNYMCVQKFTELTNHANCVVSNTVRGGIDHCQAILNDAHPNPICATVERTLVCTNALFETNCAAIAPQLEHLFSGYITFRLDLNNCNLKHKDAAEHHDHGAGHFDGDGHDHDGASKIIPPVFALVASSLFVVAACTF